MTPSQVLQQIFNWLQNTNFIPPSDPAEGDSSSDELPLGPDEEEIFADDESGGHTPVDSGSPGHHRKADKVTTARQFERDFGVKLKLKSIRPPESPIYDSKDAVNWLLFESIRI